MGQTMRVLSAFLIGTVLLAGFIGCAGHTAATAVGQETPNDRVELPDLVVEERVKEDPVVPSAVPLESDTRSQGAVVDPPPPAMKPSRAPAVPPPPDEEPEILPLVTDLATTDVFLLDIPFNFDQYSLRDDALAFVEVNATRLKAERVGAIVLEGRGDEVGTADYNLVLGERRAHEVKRYLLNLGVDSATLSIVSYGKERPLCSVHSADCWQMNRSVRFVVE